MKNSDSSDFGILQELGRGLRLFWAALLEALQLRCELFGVELKEVGSRYIALLIVGAIALLTAFMAFLCLNLLLVSIFWQDRVLIALGLFGFYLLLAVALALVTMRKLKGMPAPFSALSQVIKQDQAALVSDFESTR